MEENIGIHSTKNVSVVMYQVSLFVEAIFHQSNVEMPVRVGSTDEWKKKHERQSQSVCYLHFMCFNFIVFQQLNTQQHAAMAYKIAREKKTTNIYV